MPTDSDFRCDTEFLKLLTRRNDVDLTLAALELARDACPAVEFETTLDWLDARADELSSAIANAADEREALRELSRCLSKTHGIRGEPSAFDRADSSYLNRVIETGQGIPISLSLLYMAVAERVGIELKGVSAPMHFLARYESIDGPLFIDAYAGGRIMTAGECLAWLGKLTGLPTDELRFALRPARPKAIVLRMLNNLKALHARQENWPAAWMVQHRLAALQPASYVERRDLALISLRAERPGSAIDLLRSCIGCCPPDEKESLQERLSQAVATVARWN
ncbi:MAG: transglutaminase-like domain-containing protein [Planctomycetaceae bacterium]